MTDRELLELAAKAAGLKIDKSPYNGGGRGNTGFDILGDAVLDRHDGIKWNPLTDDGDALRLAVKLKLSLQITDHMAWYSVPDSDVWTAEEQEDLYAATRRAIVCAAAEIGKAL